MDPDSLRICFVVLHTSPLDEPGTKDAGGMNVVVRAQAAELARRGHHVEMITRRAAPEGPDVVRLGPRLSVRHLDAGPACLLSKGDHGQWIAAFADALAAHLRRHPVDVLHSEHWYSGAAALPVARAAGIPIVHSYHSIAADPGAPLSEGERPEREERLDAERELARSADLVLAVSEAERRSVIDRLGGDPRRVRVVPLGVDAKLFRPCEPDECADRGEWLTHGGRPEVLVAGRLHPLKGFDLAVRAVAAIPPARRPALRIVGAPPPDGDDYVRALHTAVADAGMISTVSFDGALRRGEFAERLRRADLVLVPSHSETFGLVALEAAACGVPVIARATGGLPEAVADGESGILVASEDPAVWAAQIERVLGDADLAGRMGSAGRRHALRRSWESSADVLLGAYRELLGSDAPALSR